MSEAVSNELNPPVKNEEVILGRYTLVLAKKDDLPRILALRAEARKWLEKIGLGNSQWHNPASEEVFREMIREGKGWMIKDGEKPIGTFFLSDQSDSTYWTEEERNQGALYFGNLIVDREYAGNKIGAKTIDWIAERAHKFGKPWIRLDCSFENPTLQDLYKKQGFTRVRDLPDQHAVLFQRPSMPPQV